MDGLTFYKDLNHVMLDCEYDSEKLSSHLKTFLEQSAERMQSGSVLKTDTLEMRMEYLQRELEKIESLRAACSAQNLELTYTKTLQLTVDGEAESVNIAASVLRDRKFHLDHADLMGGLVHRK